MNTTTQSPRRQTLIAAAVLSALALGFSAVGAAADGSNPPTAIVKYRDLNISTVAGANALYSRIRWAAQNVCRSYDRRDFKSQAQKDDCISHAIASAVTQVNEPALFMVYNAHSPAPLPTALVSQSR
jgi:UrcA family protein